MSSPMAMPGDSRRRLARRTTRAALTVVAAASLLYLGPGHLAAPQPTHAACSRAPRTPIIFRGVKGTVDRPYVTPGDVGSNPENHGGRLTLTLDSCQAAGLAFDKKEHMVALLFAPPGGGPRHALLLAQKCDGVDVATCGSQINAPDRARCVKTTIHTRPNADGDNRVLLVEVPETTAAAGFPDLTGPAAIVVTPKSAPACSIGGSIPNCRSATAGGGPLICIDELFLSVGCTLDNPQPDFTSFTVLPPINDYRRICGPGGAAPACDLAQAAKVRFTVDARGNVLMPLLWRGILRGKGSSGQCSDVAADAGHCDTRLLVGHSAVDGNADTPQPDVITLPPGATVTSHTMRGEWFEPPPAIEVNVSADGTELVLSGQAHKSKSVLRIPSCAGAGCTPNQLFDFTDRLEGGVGAITLTRSGGPGVCDTPGGTRCTTNADCAAGVVCAQFRADAGDHLPTAEAAPAPPPPPPPPPLVDGAPEPVAAPPGAAPSFLFWIALVVVVVVAVRLLWRTRRR